MVSQRHRNNIFPALVLLLLSVGAAQIAKSRAADKGPRALGLLQIAQNGKAHLVPIAILIGGRFYDASVYKADPVPMALQSDVVYEAEKTGVPQGIFTVAGALTTKEGWIGDGKWETEAQIDADKAKAKAEAAKREQKAPTDLDAGGPPKLKRAPGSEGQTPSSGSQGTSTPNSTSSGSPPASSDSHPKLTRRSDDQQSTATSASDDDPNRPTLRHQAPSQTTHEQTKPGEEAGPLTGPLELIPAISDAGGPDPRPYAYQMKPDEEQGLMKKMQAMAADEIRARAAHLSQPVTDAKPLAKRPSARASKAAPAPEYHEPQLRVFDLSNTNEPVLVFAAQAKLPASDLDFIVALVAREDIYGDLHKVYAQTTDDKHLDAMPRYDLVDAVDANGDGVGELLFRETWDSGSAYAIYSVIGDQLWPLFEGKPGK